MPLVASASAKQGFAGLRMDGDGCFERGDFVGAVEEYDKAVRLALGVREPLTFLAVDENPLSAPASDAAKPDGKSTTEAARAISR